MYDPRVVFTEEEIFKIRMLGISIKNNIIPLQYKDWYTTKSGKIWDIDTYQHGACKCLTMTEPEFLEYFETLKYDDNVCCSNIEILTQICYDYKVRSFQKLKTVLDFADDILIVEAGRGVDVLLTSFVKQWKTITAYDQDKSVLHEMTNYFAGELRLPFIARQINTFDFNFRAINERTIIFGTCHNLDEKIKAQILENGNVLAIMDGEIWQQPS